MRKREPRPWLVEAREARGYSKEKLAEVVKVSPALVGILEAGGVTHPNIALRIGARLGLKPEKIRELMPQKYWKAELPLKPMEGMEGPESRPLRVRV